MSPQEAPAEPPASVFPSRDGVGADGLLYREKFPNFMWRIWLRNMLSLNFLLLPITRLREGILGRAKLPPPLAALPLSMTFRLRMMRLRLGSRGFTLRLMIRTVSEKGETGGRRPVPPPTPLFWGSGRGRGRRDIRWHRRMSFLSRCTAALEWSLGEDVLEPGLTEKCTSPICRASAWARACSGWGKNRKNTIRLE